MICYPKSESIHIIWHGHSKGTQATQSVKWNEMCEWKDDMKHPEYELEL